LDSKTVFWTQILTTLGVILGLALVGLEIRQTQQLTQAQLSGENLALSSQKHLAHAGENPYIAISKACQNEKLSSEELIIFDALMSASAKSALRMWLIEKIGEFNRSSYDEGVRGELIDVFQTELGQRWWEQSKNFYPEDFVNFAQAWLDAFPQELMCEKRLMLLQPDD
jgi:hypothetical protein